MLWKSLNIPLNEISISHQHVFRIRWFRGRGPHVGSICRPKQRVVQCKHLWCNEANWVRSRPNSNSFFWLIGSYIICKPFITYPEIGQLVLKIWASKGLQKLSKWINFLLCLALTKNDYCLKFWLILCDHTTFFTFCCLSECCSFVS